MASHPCSVFSEERFESFSYRYGDNRLFLTLRVSLPGALKVRFRAVNFDGTYVGRTKSETFKVQPGENTLVLEPAPEGGHRISMTLGPSKMEVYANRGSWYTSPGGGNVAESHLASEIAPAGDLLVIPSGFTAAFGRTKAPTRFAVGRSFGLDQGYGLKVGKKHRALAFRTKGSLGPVMITVAERLDETNLQYWDYPVIIDEKIYRYEIPFSKFTPRGATSRPLKGIYAVSIRSLRPVKPGDRITVSYLSISEGSPFIS